MSFDRTLVNFEIPACFFMVTRTLHVLFNLCPLVNIWTDTITHRDSVEHLFCEVSLLKIGKTLWSLIPLDLVFQFSIILCDATITHTLHDASRRAAFESPASSSPPSQYSPDAFVEYKHSIRLAWKPPHAVL